MHIHDLINGAHGDLCGYVSNHSSPLPLRTYLKTWFDKPVLSLAEGSDFVETLDEIGASKERWRRSLSVLSWSKDRLFQVVRF
jgi:hypothetical protein